MPQRGIEETPRGATSLKSGQISAAPDALVSTTQTGAPPPVAEFVAIFSDAPLGQGTFSLRFRGRRPLARPCPRLISFGVPPGREPSDHAQTQGKRRRGNGVSTSFGCGSAELSRDSAESSRAARIFPGARLCARSTSRSRLAAGDASDSNERLRGFGAAAAGPRRTQPRSFGCGSAALCPSRLCGQLFVPSKKFAHTSRWSSVVTMPVQKIREM